MENNSWKQNKFKMLGKAEKFKQIFLIPEKKARK